MADVTLSQRVQVGVEATPGTAVPANRSLQSLSFAPAVKAEHSEFRPMGFKYGTVGVLNKEWSEAAIEGQPTYDEMQLVLSSVLTTAAITTPPGGTASRLWTFSPESQAADTPRTLTIEAGAAGSGNARRTAGNIVTGMGIEVTRDEITLSASTLGLPLVTEQTLTAAPTSLPVVPLTPGSVSVFLDTTAAGLGTTKLLQPFSWGLDISDRFGPVWVLDRANPSYSRTVETEPSATINLKVAADATGLGIIGQLRSQDLRFIRMEAVGPIIETTIPYRFTVDAAVRVTEVSEFSDEDGVYAVEYTLAIHHDATWGRALRVELVNRQTAL